MITQPVCSIPLSFVVILTLCAAIDILNSVQHHPHEDGSTLAYPESFDEQDWDDTLDGEGEPDTTWSVEDHDADSNESSVTLSSKTSSKRNHTEFDEDDSVEVLTEISPGKLYAILVT